MAENFLREVYRVQKLSSEKLNHKLEFSSSNEHPTTTTWTILKARAVCYLDAYLSSRLRHNYDKTPRNH